MTNETKKEIKETVFTMGIGLMALALGSSALYFIFKYETITFPVIAIVLGVVCVCGLSWLIGMLVRTLWHTFIKNDWDINHSWF